MEGEPCTDCGNNKFIAKAKGDLIVLTCESCGKSQETTKDEQFRKGYKFGLAVGRRERDQELR